jgi:hypothetical protein
LQPARRSWRAGCFVAGVFGGPPALPHPSALPARPAGAARRRGPPAREDRDRRETRAVSATVIATGVRPGLRIACRDDHELTAVAITQPPVRERRDLGRLPTVRCVPPSTRQRPSSPRSMSGQSRPAGPPNHRTRAVDPLQRTPPPAIQYSGPQSPDIDGSSPPQPITAKRVRRRRSPGTQGGGPVSAVGQRQLRTTPATSDRTPAAERRPPRALLIHYGGRPHPRSTTTDRSRRLPIETVRHSRSPSNGSAAGDHRARDV